MTDVIGDRAHTCPACGGAKTTARRTCDPCWRDVPARIKVALVVTYGRRARNPDAYAEAMADLLLWCRDRMAGQAVASVAE